MEDGVVPNYMSSLPPGRTGQLRRPTLPRSAEDASQCSNCSVNSLAYVYSGEWGRAPYPNNNVSMHSLVANGRNANSWFVQGWASW